MMQKNICFTLFSFFILFGSGLRGQENLGPFTFYPNPSSGVLLGIATIDGNSGSTGDIIAAFDENGNCAGAAELTIYGSDAYIQLPIYGNDSTTPEDDGMDAGENFTLQLYDTSEDEYLDAEAVRVVKLLPYTTAGKQRGKPVNVQYTIPINFTLN